MYPQISNKIHHLYKIHFHKQMYAVIWKETIDYYTLII